MQIYETVWHRWLRRPYELNTVIDEGHGKTVVLLHGIGRNGSVWQNLATELRGNGCHVLAYDLLGFGASPKPSWPSYTVQDHARMVKAMLPRKGKITLVGHSMGCLVAIHIASQYPGRVAHVILYEPPVFADIPEFASHARRRKIYLSIYERIADNPTAVLTYARLFGRAAARIADIATATEQWIPFERSMRNTIISQTAYNELHRLVVPTNIVYGRLDIMVSQTEVKRMFKDNQNIHFSIITDTHGVSKKASKYLAKLILHQTVPSNKPTKIHRRIASRKPKRDNKRSEVIT